MPGVRATPFVISLALHAALVTFLFAAFRAPAPVVSQRAVDILVVSPRGSPFEVKRGASPAGQRKGAVSPAGKAKADL